MINIPSSVEKPQLSEREDDLTVPTALSFSGHFAVILALTLEVGSSKKPEGPEMPPSYAQPSATDTFYKVEQETVGRTRDEIREAYFNCEDDPRFPGRCQLLAEKVFSTEVSAEIGSCNFENRARIPVVRAAPQWNESEVWYIPSGESYKVSYPDGTISPALRKWYMGNLSDYDKLVWTENDGCTSEDPGNGSFSIFDFTIERFSKDEPHLEDSGSDYNSILIKRAYEILEDFPVVTRRSDFDLIYGILNENDPVMAVSTWYHVDINPIMSKNNDWYHMREVDLEIRENIPNGVIEKLPDLHIKFIRYDTRGRPFLVYELARDLVDKPQMVDYGTPNF